jgi:phenylpropionate dioxygenase-like ring-hydroxylating dioxygenase large terminal subunit
MQLPVNAYFDKTLLKWEIQQLFKAGPRYVGHELMVPNVGDYATLASENEGRMLIRNLQGIMLLSNVCRHRQAKMFSGFGNTQNIVCPLHRWTYNIEGELIGTPYFSEKICTNLSRTPLQNWNGLLFEKNAFEVSKRVSKLSMSKEFNFGNYLFDHAEVHECNYNWKTFIEVYLEDYHVESFHPGLSKFVSCENLTWQFSEDCSAQILDVNHRLEKFGSIAYKKWQEQLLKFSNGTVPKFGAIWLTLYPNIMVEWYPQVLIISTVWPHSPQKTINVVEFYYPEEIMSFEREIMESGLAAYMETYAEDNDIALRMDSGRRALMQRGVEEVGPYQSPMEDGMKHFHEWYQRKRNSL